MLHARALNRTLEYHCDVLYCANQFQTKLFAQNRLQLLKRKNTCLKISKTFFYPNCEINGLYEKL